ncbi:M23 family metallopeptidase [Brevibacillus centrosporus]|uniref:Murein DD-endopeptidase MepM and murein hydrolase activator NlpD, contain LysM domain n=1 Tax=Brevibacillus centrosporus TaxID=54910 RepID=A0A1I3UV12_9BACL|nr:M23 family metallopeptidase [Brevibacillus centrosporus]MED4911412.1 M23 family metallopeptidase [Brevibacillus centrosporus]SFJ85697.1 Murein DD-endopeptidase MepM and murein hydrolase activator NlpD, contain LysM domain [Brevibacillus centrosporus]
MPFEQIPAPIESLDEAKRTVVEQALFQAFNPYAGLAKSDASSKSNVMVYAVNQGDTLSGIAQRYGLTLRRLVEINKINNPNFVSVGMKLIISKDEVKHIVKRGETLNYIASRYRVSRELLIDRNPLLRWLSDNLYVGQVVYVPIVGEPSLQAEDLQQKRNTSQAASRQVIGRIRERMEWPVKEATITSGFGVRWGKAHKGVDLWNQSEAKAPIYAAKSGVVVEAGANRSGYGRMVVLDHGDGLQTFYAHMRSIIVAPGQSVDAGEMLGYMGHTGDSTGYHLHFEVRQDDVPINPLPYLGR